MASLNENAFGSDDEDDLEYLRLAALQSLKPKANSVVSMKQLDTNHGRPQNMYKQHSTFGAAQTTRNHNRGFRNNGGRLGRNGINSRTRGNSNLISIQVIDENDSKESVLNVIPRTTAHVEAPKLILPQDRYYKTQAPDIIKEKESSGNKFNRYENSSDDSDSDSDELNLKPVKRERKNSLEALIDDIDNILEGKNDYQTKTEDKKSESGDEKIDTLIINSQTSVDSDNGEDLKLVDSSKEASDTLVIEEIDADIVQIIDENDDEVMSPPKLETNEKEAKCIRSRSKSRSPYLAIAAKSRSRSRSVKSRSKSPYNNKVKSPYRSPRRSRSRSPIRKNRYSPLPYPRPLSPLTLNTDVLNSTMAPLSPRSAAFVLQNRQILARRQRSRSPRNRDNCMRRSSSPKRMKLSPRRRTRSRSRSPRFGSVRKCSLSPRKRSNSPKFSPKRRSTSPRNYLRRSPNMNRYRNRNSNSPVVKQSIHKRLGTKNVSSYDRKAEPITKRKRTSRSLSLSLSPSPDRNYHKRPLNETTGQVNENKRRKDSPNSSQKSEYKEEKPLDSILLARKKKFESPVQLGKNNCVIKLNTNKSKQTDRLNEDVTDEDYVLLKESRDTEQDEIFEKESVVDGGSDVEIELNPTIDDLWSDEESDDENEGRFKSKTSNKKTVPTISIRNLTEKPVTTISILNLSEKPAPKEPLHSRVRLENTIAYRTYSSQRSKYGNRRNRSPPVNANSKIDSLKSYSHEKRLKDRDTSRSKMKYESRDKKDKAIADKSDKNKEIDEEKIESKEIMVKPLQQSSEDKLANRRVKIDPEPELVSLDSSTENNDEPEIIIENDDDATPNDDESVDLRAELSRRRAERLQKAGCIAGAVPTRLLKNALQEVVPKRPTSKTLKINKGGGENAADRKVLIMKSLASSPITKIEPANKASKKEGGKLPIHMRLGQSNLGETYAAEEGDERERRLKKSRSGKRKTKQVVQV